MAVPPQGLGPEVMQALVEHFAARGQPERVERCVLHLSIAALDLDQVGAQHGVQGLAAKGGCKVLGDQARPGLGWLGECPGIGFG